MKKIILLLITGIIVSCSNYGEKITQDGTEVYYEDPALKEMAEATAGYLKEMGFTDGTPKSVQITKDSMYNFRMVVQEGVEKDENMEVSFMALGFLLSKEIFDGEAINFQLCDNTFATIKSIPIEGAKTTVKN